MAAIRALYIGLIFLLSSTFNVGAELGYASFLIPSILMGLGVAIDVFIATVVKFNDNDLTWKNWTLPVTATHVLFPAFGYFVFFAAASALPVFRVFFGVAGFLLVALFIYEVVSESAGVKPIFGISAAIGKLIGFSANDARTFVAILAVSWDALWSGPAKAAQATAGGWSILEVLLSFIIAGVVVALMAEFALLITKLLRKREFKNVPSLSRFNILGTYMELTVIGGFGVLSLWYAFSTQANLYASIAISSIVLLLIFTLLLKPLWKNELEHISEVVDILTKQ